MMISCYTTSRWRECWNWQTGKTKDLVGVCSCGFKSHFPQAETLYVERVFFLSSCQETENAV